MPRRGRSKVQLEEQSQTAAMGCHSLQQCTSWGSYSSKCWGVCGGGGKGADGTGVLRSLPLLGALEQPLPPGLHTEATLSRAPCPSQDSSEKGPLFLHMQCLALWPPAWVLSHLHELLTFLGF